MQSKSLLTPRRELILCGVVILLLATLCGCQGPGVSRNSKVTIGDQLPGFSLTDLNGKKYTEASIGETEKSTIIAIFATWCAPCQIELVQLQQDIGIDHPKYNLLAIGTGEPAELVKEFAEQNRLTFPVLSDPDSGFANAVGGSALPRSIVVDSKGKIISQHVGYDARLIKTWAAESTQAK